MNAGVLGEVLHQFPYQFNGHGVLATIFFLFALVLFILFTILLLLRLAWFKGEAYAELTATAGDIVFVPCWAISFMTLTGSVGLIVSTSTWGGYDFTIVAYVMWWFVSLWNLSILFWAFTVIIRNGLAKQGTDRISFAIIIPAVSVSTLALTGGLITAYSTGMTTNLAIPVIILSFNFAGIGILLGVILSCTLLQDLLENGWPAPGQITTLFILVGPMGQSAAALVVLGSAASTSGYFGLYNTGAFLTAQSAQALSSACTLTALLLSGLGTIWVMLALIGMIDCALQKKLTWTLSWNAIIFPR